MTAKDIMTKNVISVSPATSTAELARLLTEKNISGVPVVDSENRVIGIVTEKDLMYRDTELRFPPFAEILGARIYLGGVKKYNAQLKKILAATASDLMTTEVITVGEDTGVGEISRLMLDNNINRVPVTDSQGKLCGIISRADIVRYIASAM